MAVELPLPTKRFLRTTRHRRVRHIVHAFHRWLAQRQLTLVELTPALLKQFLARPGRMRISPKVSRLYRPWLHRYLRWLHDRGLVRCIPEFGRPPPQELPPPAQAFLSSLVPTFRPATIHCYTFSLRKLYSWLGRHGLTPERVTRPQIEPWFRWLHDAGLHPSSRHHVLVESRAYLRWLGERRRMRTPADELIRKTDFPRLPRYLPRPLSAEADRELQHRLAASSDPIAWALLLMRRTGLRIGELRNLEYHCARADERRPLLKVPLGKLNNERLVPLDSTALEMVRRLQSTGIRSRSWLVPTVGRTRTSYHRIRIVLLTHSRGLPEPSRITCHRLRHTFATEMLSAGMSLLGVMRLLGHRDVQMTLRYAAITPEIVDNEYTKALASVAAKYRLPAQTPPFDGAREPVHLLDLLSRWLRKHASSPQQQRVLLKRIERLRCDIQSLGPADRDR